MPGLIDAHFHAYGAGLMVNNDRIMKLNVLSQDAYAEIAAEVQKTIPKPPGGSN